MRIQCPNCDAQYEVPDEVIPFEGRDVQCSNCGRTWFHAHPDNPDAASEETDDDEQDEHGEPEHGVDDAGQDDAQDGQPEQQDAMPSAQGAADHAGYEDEEEDEDDLGPEPAPDDRLQRKPLDSDVETILREEAEREQAARAAETLEIQQDLGLTDTEDQSQRRARESRERMARLRGEPQELETASPPEDTPASDSSAAEAAAAAAALGSRRELLPDIEEINSTLRSTSDREVAGGDPTPEASIRGHKRRGFRRGFTTTLLIFATALLIYVFAQEIAEAVPQADPLLSAYVNWVDGLRLWLDGQMRSLSDWLNRQAGQA